MCFISGEDELSFAYDGRGKKVSDGTQEEYGEPLSEGDIIGCYAVSCLSLCSLDRVMLGLLFSNFLLFVFPQQ